MHGENPNTESSENNELQYNSYSSQKNNEDGYVKPSINEPPEQQTAPNTPPPYDNRENRPQNAYSSYGNYVTGWYPPTERRGNSPEFPANTYVTNNSQPPKTKKNYWLVPVAVILCFFMCAACFLAGITAQSGDTNGGTTPPSGNGTAENEETENSPFLGGGDVTLEQLPSDSVYYTIPSVVSATQDTVVEITTETMTTGSYWGQYVTEGAGSGVIIKTFPDKGDSGACGSYIITNHHVIDGAFSIKVTLRNGTGYSAALVATDPQTDIAVLHIDEANLPVATLGTSSTLVAGQTVVVIGNPLGSLGGSVSSGIISCTERNIEIQDVVMKLIQTTAAVNPGNSGGAMFDLEGKLVGVVNAKYSDEQIEGIGFAIPIDIAAKVAEDLINYGYVTGRPNHGITTYYGHCTYRNVYVSYDGVKVQGVWASQVAEGSDAKNAGMLEYDLINSVIDEEGKTYVFSSAADADAFFDSLSVGDKITVNAYRFTPSGGFAGTTFEREEYNFTFTITEYKNA